MTEKPSPRKPFTPKPPRPAAERLPLLYRSLTDQVNDGYFDNAIKTCKKILILDPTSKSAFQTLLFLHLHTDDYPSALNLLTSPPSESLTTTSGLDFERAYCLYRLHREKEALAVLESIKRGEQRGRKVDHLEAQIKYRLGEYERAQEIYEDLLAGCDSSSPEHPDILTNLSATNTHLTFLQSGYHTHLSPDRNPKSSTTGYTPTEEELETYVPSLPTGWAKAGLPSAADKKTSTITASAKNTAASSSKAANVDVKQTKDKPRHKLPKGAIPGKPFTIDPERWTPLRQRTSYLAGPVKKKGGKEGMGTGMTQGSTSGGPPPAAGGGGSGGAKGKKGKKK